MTAAIVDGGEPGTPVLGRYPNGTHIPQAWQGVGRQRSSRKGRVYHPRRRRARRRLMWTVIAILMAVAGIAVPVIAALYSMLVLEH